MKNDSINKYKIISRISCVTFNERSEKVLMHNSALKHDRKAKGIMDEGSHFSALLTDLSKAFDL